MDTTVQEKTISYPTDGRAKKNREDRKRLVDRLMTKVKKGEVPVKNLLSNYGTKKYITVEKMVRAKVNKEKIQADALWDGLHGIITNIRGGKVCKRAFKALSGFMEDRGGFSSEQAHLEDEASVSLEEGEDRGTYRDMFFGLFLVLHYEI